MRDLIIAGIAAVAAVLDTFTAPAGWTLALFSQPVKEDGDIVGFNFTGGKDGKDFALDGCFFITTPMTDDAALKYLKGTKGTTVWTPEGEQVQLNGLQAAAWKQRKHESESNRGALRKESEKVEITHEMAQLQLLGLRSKGRKAVEPAVLDKKEYTAEEVAALIAAQGGRVVKSA